MPLTERGAAVATAAKSGASKKAEETNDFMRYGEVVRSSKKEHYARAVPFVADDPVCNKLPVGVVWYWETFA